MNKWTEKYLVGLRDTGKINGFKVSEKGKAFSSGKAVVRGSSYHSHALDWLGWNLLYWSNEHALTLEKEYIFCERGWRFDYAWPAIKIAVEFEGGVYMEKSGHNTARHYTKDTEKYNRATMMGWRVIRVTAMNYTTVLKTLNDIIK